MKSFSNFLFLNNVKSAYFLIFYHCYTHNRKIFPIMSMPATWRKATICLIRSRIHKLYKWTNLFAHRYILYQSRYLLTINKKLSLIWGVKGIYYLETAEIFNCDGILFKNWWRNFSALHRKNILQNNIQLFSAKRQDRGG